MDSSYCKDCMKDTDVVFDHQAGDAICTECGLVLDSHVVDVTAEYRKFSDQDFDKDPTRVGAGTDPLLDNFVFSTHISKHNNCEDLNHRFNRSVANQDTNKQPLIKAFGNIDWMADKIGIPAAISNDAKVLYKTADDKHFCRGKDFGAITAACLFLACQANGTPKTLKQIAFYAEGASQKTICRMVTSLTRNNVLEVDRKTTNARDLAPQFCSNLGMNHDESKAVKETLEKLEELDIIRRKPASVVAAAMYMIVQLSSIDKSLQDIAEATGTAVGTIRKGYKELYPYASRIIPNKYDKLEDVKKLWIP